MKNKKLSGEEALLEAQKIAFAPVIFQTARLLRDFGIFKMLYDNKKTGCTIEEIAKEKELSTYAVEVLCESGLSMNALELKDDKFFLTDVGYFLLFDDITNINMNFNHDVNYIGLFDLDKALLESKPSGLHRAFNSSWETIYPHLSELPEKAKKSWFKFDHFYSDACFKTLVKIMAERAPKKLMDIGGNTGKWAIALTQASPKTHVTIVDHPKQIDIALTNAENAGVADRVDGIAMDILDHSQPFKEGYDAIWMSQFLDCFGPEDIVKILKRVNKAIDENAKVYIIEPFWDRQSHNIGSFCLINTSPYFTALANGKSKMYKSTQMKSFVENAGLKVVEQIDNLGFGHTLMVCKKSFNF